MFFALQRLEIINCKSKNTMRSPALEMRHFVDGISMKSAGFISCGIQTAGLVWTDFRNGIGAELTPRSQNHLGRKRWHWSHETWDLSCHSNRGMGVSHKWSWIWGFLIWILTRNRKKMFSISWRNFIWTHSGLFSSSKFYFHFHMQVYYIHLGKWWASLVVQW